MSWELFQKIYYEWEKNMYQKSNRVNKTIEIDRNKLDLRHKEWEAKKKKTLTLY